MTIITIVFPSHSVLFTLIYIYVYKGMAKAGEGKHEIIISNDTMEEKGI